MAELLTAFLVLTAVKAVFTMGLFVHYRGKKPKGSPTDLDDGGNEVSAGSSDEQAEQGREQECNEEESQPGQSKAVRLRDRGTNNSSTEADDVQEAIRVGNKFKQLRRVVG
jgi:hypothetical protein